MAKEHYEREEIQIGESHQAIKNLFGLDIAPGVNRPDQKSRKSRQEEEKRLAGLLQLTRTTFGLSQVYLGKRTGLSRNAIAEIESGNRRVSALELRDIVDVYGLPVELFFYGPREPFPFPKVEYLDGFNEKPLIQALSYARFLRDSHESPEEILESANKYQIWAQEIGFKTNIREEVLKNLVSSEVSQFDDDQKKLFEDYLGYLKKRLNTNSESQQ